MTTETRELDAALCRRETQCPYSDHWFGYAIISPRVVMGWTRFQGGLTKLVTYLDGNPENNWTAAEFLQHAVPEGTLS